MPHYNQTHGHTTGAKASKTYKAWVSMRRRCLNPEHPAYDRYGGRGILPCKRWGKFENFIADMGEAPKGMSLDRKDNNKGYSKKNCRWATPTEQNQNRRNARMFTIGDETCCLSEWARRHGIRITTVFMRLEYGWSIDKALTTKSRKDHP